MNLVTEDLGRFVGGQVESQDTNGFHILRGEIASIEVDAEQRLQIVTNWTAELVRGEWLELEKPTFVAELCLYAVADIGEGRVLITSEMMGELATLFPIGGSKLDRNRVKKRT